MGYNKVFLYGGQICDYLAVQDSISDISQYSYVNSEPKKWDDNTLLLARFDNNLIAGESSLVDSIVGYEVRRQDGAGTYSKYIGSIQASEEKNPKKYMIDYSAVEGSYYTYYLYPASEKSDAGVVLTPLISKDIKPKWGYWSLLIVDESEEENVFYLNKMFKFELNLSTDDMNNNSTSNITQNFTKYPTVQHGMSNYWSGGLSALCGIISCNDVDYIQTANMVKELKAISSDSRRKFLKDMDGNIYEVEITSPINISTDDATLERIKSTRISWTEVGDASGISIINNPNQSATSWILTETGEVVPYVSYIWDEHYRWDNSYRWTAHEGRLDTDISNLGKPLFEKGDEI